MLKQTARAPSRFNRDGKGSSRMRVLVVYCHPVPESFCAAVRDATGIEVSCHDLRRTFVTTAEAGGTVSHPRNLIVVERGARASAFDAATLGLDDRLRELLAEHPEESLDALLWGACQGGQRETAADLVGRGADPGWVGWDDLTPVGAAERAGAQDLADWLRARPPGHPAL